MRNIAARTEAGRHETLAATECGIQCPIQVEARYKKAPGISDPGRIQNAGPADHYDLAVALQHDTPGTVILVGENIHNRNAVLAESVVGRAVRHVAHHRDILIAIPSGSAHNDDLVVELDGEVVGPIEPLGIAQIRDDQPIAAEGGIRVPARGLGRLAEADQYGENPRLSLTFSPLRTGRKGTQKRRFGVNCLIIKPLLRRPFLWRVAHSRLLEPPSRPQRKQALGFPASPHPY